MTFILAEAEICRHVDEINLNQDRPNPILITSKVILYPGATLELSKVGMEHILNFPI